MQIYHRFFDLKRELLELSKAFKENKYHGAIQSKHHDQAKSFFEEALNLTYFTENYNPKEPHRVLRNPENRKKLYQEIISSHVEMDQVRHYKIQPEEGWVELIKRDFDADKQEELIVDTQLARYYLKNSELTEIDYKPKKLNLIDTFLEYENKMTCGCFSLFDSSKFLTKNSLIRKKRQVVSSTFSCETPV